MTVAKKKKLTQILVSGNVLIEDGSAFRMNLMRIIFRVMQAQHGGQCQDFIKAGKVITASYMSQSDLPDSIDDIQKFEKDCIGYINYTAYYTPEEIEEQGKKLLNICKENGVTVGMGCLTRQMNMRNMTDEMSIWSWEI